MGVLGDGFEVGHKITVSGFSSPANNGEFIVTGVTPLTLTVDGPLVNEVASGDEKIVVHVPKTGITTIHMNAADIYSDIYALDRISEVTTRMRIPAKYKTVQRDEFIIARAPHHYEAHFSALQYWCAKWRGSEKLATEFAERAAANAPLGGLLTVLPLIAHFEHDTSDDAAADRTPRRASRSC